MGFEGRFRRPSTRILILLEVQMTRKGKKAIVIHERDNVATSLTPLNPGQSVSLEIRGRKEDIILQSRIPAGHKLALEEIEAGKDIIKYGEPIGQAVTRIARGEHVHVHNVVSKVKKWKGGR
jgi:altronate dehydratase small subunit